MKKEPFIVIFNQSIQFISKNWKSRCNGNPIDDRNKNSWNSTLEEIPMTEILEVNLINQISPYLLIKELSPLMKKSTFKYKFIVNVTSSEGQFSFKKKAI